MKAFTMNVILMLLFVGTSLQECTDGCLKCSSDNECEFCDYRRNFILENGSCVVGQIEGCEIYNVEGICLRCQTNYYLDQLTLQCLAIPESLRIENCQYYETEQSCMVCDPSFYLNSLICSPILTPVENCETYIDAEKCGECKEGYIVQHDNKQCLKESNVSNCQTFTSIRCNTCQTNNYLQNNFWSIWIQHLLKTNLANKEQRALDAFYATKVETSNNCVQPLPQNCQQLEDFTSCHICNVGYFLKDGDCIENPPVALPHCEDYTSDVLCKKCEQGYHLTLSPEYHCKNVYFVENCINFDGTAFYTKCLECKDRFYLNPGTNDCIERINIIEFCQTYETELDQCKQCDANYQVTSDGKKCLPITQNCQTYLDSDETSTELICQECVDYYYLTSDYQCSLGSTENCRIYERTIDQCRLCEDNYFLNSDLLCEQHPNIDGCKTYDPYIPNRCTECQFDRFLLTLQTECVQAQVENCRLFKTIDNCAECNEGYTLLNNGQCAELDPELNCLLGEYGLCIKCKEGYMIDQGLCVDIIINDKNVCQVNQMPIDYKSSIECVSKEDLLDMDLHEDNYNGDHCLAYQHDETYSFRCIKCEPTYVPDQTGTCVLQSSSPVCTDDDDNFYRDLNYDLKKEQDEFIFVKDNVCLKLPKSAADAVDNCKNYGIQKGQFNYQKEVQYGCLSCVDAPSATERQFQMVNPSTNEETLYKDSTQLFWKSEFTCEPKTTTSDFSDLVWGDITGLDNCEYFYNLQHNKIGCMRCKQGFNGVIRNPSIERCLEYDPINLKCTKCQENYLLQENGKECVYYTAISPQVTHTVNCKVGAFDETKCYQCEDGYTLSNDGLTCTQFTGTYPITNCAAYTHNAPGAIAVSCERCDDGYYLSDDKSGCWQVSNCLVPASATTCQTCELGYELNGSSTCDAVAGCDYNELNSATCIVESTYNIKTINQCLSVIHDGCIDYDQTTGLCKECESGKYLFEDNGDTDDFTLCVTNGQFPGTPVTLTVASAGTDNCKVYYVLDSGETFSTLPRYGCLQCDDNYYFADVSQKGLADFNCIQNSYIDRDADKLNADENNLLLSEYTTYTNCELYDFLYDQCLQCTATTHYLSNGLCCAVGEYNPGSACVPIPSADYPYCDEIQYVRDQGYYECTSCVASYNLVDGICTNTTPCDNYSQGQCIDKTAIKCTTFDIVENECDQCNSNTYIVPSDRDICCADGQFVSSGSCGALSGLTLSDTDIQDNIKTSCLEYDPISQECLKCAAGKTFTGKVCVATDDLYKNCLKISSVNNLCEICKADYYLTPYGTCCQISTNQIFVIATGTCTALTGANVITDCLFYSADAANSCQTCKDGFWNYQSKACCKNGEFIYNTKASSDDCMYNSDTYRYCQLAQFDTTDLGDYSCTLCNSNYSSDITENSSNFCCQHGSLPNATTGVCEANTTCQQFKTSTTCYTCKLEQQLLADETCIDLISNCNNATDTSTCAQCNYGYIVDFGASNVCEDQTANSKVGQFNCGVYDSSDSSSPKACTSCFESFQIQTDPATSCCSIGTYHKETNFCPPIPLKNCAVYDSTNDVCTMCFQDEDHCLVEFDYSIMSATQQGKYLSSDIPIADLRISNNIKYYMGTDKQKNCCQFGYYFNGTDCIPIETQNCKKYDIENSQCMECDNNYVLSNSICVQLDPSQCSMKNTVTTTYYNSNGVCCPLNKYWNKDQQICEDIPDNNCEQSNDGVHCDVCVTGFVSQTFLKKKYELHYQATFDNCPHIHIHRSFYNCITQANYDAYKVLTDQTTFEQIAENCADVDYTKLECNKCLDGYYRPEGVNICCADGSVAVEVEGRHYCRALSTISDSCVTFNAKTNKCEKCIDCDSSYTSGFSTKCQLSGGMCCPRFKHFNIMTGQCENMLLGECKDEDVDYKTKQCRKCPKGYFFYYTGCVKEHYKFTDMTMTATADGDDSRCLQEICGAPPSPTINSQGTCGLCDPNETDYYYYKGHCVQKGTTSGTTPSDNGFANCLEFSSYENCKVCDSGNNLISGRCCPDGQIWNGNSCVASSIANCAKEDPYASTNRCIECNSPYVLVEIENPDGIETQCVNQLTDAYDNQYIWGAAPATTDTLIQNIALEEIKSTSNCIVFKDGECVQCATNYILAYETVDVAASGDPTDNRQFTRCISGSSVANCLYHDADDITKCLVCDGKKNIDANGKCLGSLTLENCLKSDADGCTECKKNYLLRSIVSYDTGSAVTVNRCWFNTTLGCAELEDNSVLCKQCKDNSVLTYNRYQCLTDITTLDGLVQDCVVGVYTDPDNSASADCQKCAKDFYLASATTCTAVGTALENCQEYNSDGTKCVTCVDGYYSIKTQTMCCPYDQIQYEDNCVDWKQFQKQNCKAYKVVTDANDDFQRVECTQCQDNYQLTNGMCCPDNQIGMEGFCFTPESAKTNNCKILDGVGRCKTCEDTYYLTNGGCCQDEYYFDIKNNSCQPIDNSGTSNVIANGTTGVKCLKVDDNFKCIECDSNARLYDGICYSSSHAIDPFDLSSSTSTATNEYFPHCTIVIDNVCTACATSYSIGGGSSSQKCCGSSSVDYYYDEDQKRCIQISANCDSFDLTTNTCLKCATNYYSTGTYCCQSGQYYNESTGTCDAISNLSPKTFAANCQRITTQDLKDEKCSMCSSTQYALIDGVCYKKTETVTTCNSKRYEDCLTCTGSNIISGIDLSVCCPDNQIYNPATRLCEPQSDLTTCKNQLSTTECSECNGGYYLLNSTTCCENGHKPNGTTCDSSVSIEKCMEWGTKDGNEICLTCLVGFQLYAYYNSSDEYTTVCCEDAKFLDPISGLCVEKADLTLNDACTSFDTLYLAPFYKQPVCNNLTGTQYVSSDFICSDNQMFDATTSACVAISGYPNCTRVSEGKCLACSGANYLIKGKCCPEGEFSNGTAACAASSANGLVDCKKFYEECPERDFNADDEDIVFNTDCQTFTIGNLCKECDSGNYLTYAYKCCALGSYWDNTNSICKEYNLTNAGDLYRKNLEDNCDEFGENFECLVCGNSKVLSQDHRSCCASTSDFIDLTGDCLDTYTIPTSCKIYDNVLFKCKECSTGYYLTEGECCQDGQYYERSSKLCKAIVTATLGIDTNCDQYDELLGCLDCADSFEMNDQQICIAVPTGCDNFEPNTLICTQCIDGYYLSEYGNCCTPDNFDAYGICKDIDTRLDINNCKEFHSGKCALCENNHYLIQGECCPYGSYYDRTSTNNPPCTAYSSSDYNNVANCQQYGHAKEFCNVCEDDYMLIRYLWGDKCVHMKPSGTSQITNCEQYLNTYDSTNSVEQVECTKCSFSAGNLYKLEALTTATTATDILPQLEPTVTECEIYDIQNQFQESKFVCLKCSDNFYLQYNDNTNVCVARSAINVAQCVGNKPIDKDECDQCDDGYYVNYMNQCEAIPMDDCIHYDRETELCLKCSIDSEVAATTAGYDQSTMVADVDYRQMILKYFLVNDYLRSECSLVKHTPSTFPDHYLGYIDKCETDADQETTLAINLDNFYDKWYPFHFCTDSNEIPIAFVKAGEDFTGMPYGLGQYSTKDLSGQGSIDIDDIDQQIEASIAFDQTADFGKSTQCISAYSDVLTGTLGDPKSTPISNCAMVMINVEMPFETTEGAQANPDFSKLSTFCTACKIGYAPVRNGFLPIVVNECQAVSNCDTSGTSGATVLNGCGQCTKNTSDVSQNYSFQVNEDGIVDYTKCVQTDDVHCTLLNLDNTCKYCEQGYLPNYDGKCSQYAQLNCQDDFFSFQKGFTVDNFEFVLAYLGTHKGCDNCSTGYKGLLIETKKLVCTVSSTVENKDYAANTTIYDEGCEQYGIFENEPVCKQCSPEYLMDQNKKCVQSILENCSIVVDANTCAICHDEYILENGLCIQPQIENCVTYSFNIDEELICIKCEDTYLLKDNVCIGGHIDNCRTYNESKACTQCLDYYVLVELKDGSQQCSAIDQEIHPNCIQYDSSAFNNNEVQCIQCSTLQYLPIHFETDKDICLQIEVIEHCIKYNKEPLFVHSSLTCLECEDKYVLQGDKCVEREVAVDNCAEYSKFEHQCIKCENDYYLSTNGLECIKEPTGIANCDVYSDYNECKHCINDTYLYQNECLAVPTPIQHCKYYRDALTCSLCYDQYILENNVCKEYQISCETYLSSDECATCPTGQGIKYENGKRVCAIFNVVQYCDIHEQIEPYACKKCIDGYFLYDELPRYKCVKAINPVSNCLEYSGPEDCSLCEDGYLLSIDMRSCIEETFNDGCASRSEVEPYCVQCQSGYVLNENEECIEQDTNIPEGCLGLGTDGTCYMCISGYYQDDQKNCIKL